MTIRERFVLTILLVGAALSYVMVFWAGGRVGQ